MIHCSIRETSDDVSKRRFTERISSKTARQCSSWTRTKNKLAEMPS